MQRRRICQLMYFAACVLLLSCGRGSQFEPGDVVRLWDGQHPPPTPEEAQVILKRYRDDQLDQPFPDVPLEHVATHRITRLRDLDFGGQPLLFFWAGRDCGYAKIDLRYYQSRGWTLASEMRVVVALHPRAELESYATYLTGPVDVYYAPFPLPGWLEPLSIESPTQFVVDTRTWRLTDWYIHNDNALTEFAPDLLRRMRPYHRSARYDRERPGS